MIQKAILMSAVAALTSLMAQAGQIQIQVGQISGSTNLGLTSGTVLNTGSSTSGTGTGITTTNVTLAPYNPFLFESATENGTAVPMPTGNVTDPNNAAGSATFSLIGAGGNTWYATSTTNPDSIIIPINTNNVSEVSTMLNDQFGSNTDVTFVFNTLDSTTLGTPTDITVDLFDGTDISSAMQCTSNCPAGYTTATNATETGGLASYYVGNSSTPGGTLSVTTGNIQFPGGTNPAYNGTVAGKPLSGTSGNLILNDQSFNISALSALYGSYLVELEVSQAPFTATSSDTGHFDLQAVTLEAAAPEPSTFVLILAGLGLAGYSRVRRPKNSVSL